MTLLAVGVFEGFGLALICYLAAPGFRKWWRQGPGYWWTRVRGRRHLRRLRAAYEPRMSEVIDRPFTEQDLILAELEDLWVLATREPRRLA